MKARMIPSVVAVLLLAASVASAQVVVGPTSVYYPSTANSLVPTTTFGAPGVVYETPVYGSATTTYYAPATTTFYAPPTTTFYAPATTAYYAPTTAYYAPAVTVAPTVTYYAPVPAVVPMTTYYAPVVGNGVVVAAYTPAMVATPYIVGRGSLGQPKVYVAGQPIRNAMRFVTP